MDKRIAEVATQVAEIVSKSGLTPLEIEFMFRASGDEAGQTST